MATRTEQAGRSLRNVAILRPGSYRDMQGRPVEFSEERLREIAASYDPDWHLATLNLDHADSGPALGRVTALRFADGYLWADIAGLPDWFAAELAAGRWPARSAEIWPQLDGRGAYLRGLAFLGARAPAVRGLPALPAPSAGLAGPLGRDTICILMEAEMEGMTGMPDGAELTRLSTENRRLAGELAALRRRSAGERVDKLLEELRLERRLSPGMEAAGLRELLLALQAEDGCISLADGGEATRFDCLAGLLRSLPPLELDTPLGEAGEAPLALSAYEREIAASLGLTDTEYAQIRDGRTA